MADLIPTVDSITKMFTNPDVLAALDARIVSVGGGAGGGGTVFYGSDADTARPESAEPIMWVGDTGVTPVNAVENDLIFRAEPSTPNNLPTVTLSLSADERLVTATWVTDDADDDVVTATNINWGDGSATVDDPTSGITHEYDEDGTYTVTVTVTDGTDENADDDEITVEGPVEYPPGTYVTDFQSGTIGVAPSGWTVDVWGTGNTISFAVAADPTDGTDKALQVTKTTGGTNRAFCSWNTPVEALTDPDVEVLVKWQSPSFATDAMRLLLRAAGTAGAEDGIAVRYASATQIQFTQYVDGTATAIGGTPTAPSWVANTWMMTRFRVFGSQAVAKFWAATDTEPATWLGPVTVPAGVSAAGKLGLLIQKDDGRIVTYDWISVATGGDTAPTLGSGA